MRRSPATRAALALLLFTPGTLASQTPHPYDEAVAARQAGEPGEAIALLEPWLAQHPGDADARVQLGYAYLAVGDLAAAEAEFRTVLSAAPDYADATQGLALVAQRRGADSRRQSQMYIEGAASDLSGDRPNWTELTAGALVAPGPGVTLDLRASHYRRFGLQDVELAAGGTVQAGADTWLRFGASVTPSADFRPKWGMAAGVEQRVAGGSNPTLVGFDLRYERFPAQDVLLLSPIVTQYFANGRFSMTARVNAVAADGGSLRLGGSLRTDYFPGDRARFFLGAAAGPDTDLGVVTDTQTIFGGTELPLTGAVSLTAAASREWRDDGLDRTEGRLGVRFNY